MKRRKWLLGLLLLCAIPFALSHASAKELITHFEVPQIRLYAASRGSNCLSVTSTGSSVVDKSRTYTIKSTNPDVK